MPDKSEFHRKVEEKASRKLNAKRNALRSIWFGLGMFGLIGWSIVVPTVLGAMLGIWLDKNYPVKVSWTLSLLVAGLCLGCFNAWHWIEKENKSIDKEHKQNNNE